MSGSERPTVSARHKKACTECRQQKAKCDAYMNPDAPCSRCRKVGARCVISDPFKREHKRKRLSQLEREAEDLRKRLHRNNQGTTMMSPVGGLNVTVTETSTTPRSLGSSTPDVSPSHSIDPPFATQINARPAPSVLPPSNRNDGPTQARALKGTQLEAHEINDIFQLFFRDFAPFLPILDPAMGPNGYYDQSPLLFWTVILVASRSYDKNPTLFPTLADPVFEMMLLSMKSNSTPVFKIQAFLLFLTWPLPILEVPFPLCGWLLNLAMQNGLHMPMASHEFGRNLRTSQLEPSRANKSVLTMDMQRRSELWSYCIVVYQRACLQKGQPPRAMLGLVPESGQHLCYQVPPILALQLRCLDIVSKCSTSIFAAGVRNTSPEHERSMSILIRAHETQLNDLVSQLPPNHNTLYPTIALLQVQVFYLYKDLTGPFNECFIRLANTACSVIEHIKVLFDRPAAYAASPIFATNSLILACASLLRLLKSSMASKIDAEKAKSYLFTGITTIKHTILDANDLASKCSQAMNQVWNSSKAFRKSDGTEYATLRIRSRLVMSPVIDLAWWWREEFEPEEVAQRLEAEKEANKRDDVDISMLGPSNVEEYQFLNDEFLTDFEWALGNDILLPTGSGFADMPWPGASSALGAELSLPLV